MKYVYIAFYTGITFPIVFILAAIAIVNSHVFGKISLAYFYKAPPKYDNKLSNLAKRILLGAPLMGFIWGYWSLGNPAMFLDPELFLETQYQIVNDHHIYFNLT